MDLQEDLIQRKNEIEKIMSKKQKDFRIPAINAIYFE